MEAAGPPIVAEAVYVQPQPTVYSAPPVVMESAGPPLVAPPVYMTQSVVQAPQSLVTQPIMAPANIQIGEVRKVVREVDKIIYQDVERIVEVPQIQYEEIIVEDDVLEVEEVIKEVVVPQVQFVKKQVNVTEIPQSMRTEGMVLMSEVDLSKTAMQIQTMRTQTMQTQPIQTQTIQTGTYRTVNAPLTEPVAIPQQTVVTGQTRVGVFDAIDSNHDGVITRAEFAAAIQGGSVPEGGR
jgi:hypothetical protein